MASERVEEAKVNVTASPMGDAGEKFLARGSAVAMRLWEDEAPGDQKPVTRRDYETVGLVLQGRAQLLIEGQVVSLEPGDSWVVPKGAEHTYRILESFSAIEAISPPGQLDAPMAQ